MGDLAMSEEVELNENMTSEDLAAYAETVAKEVQAERQGSRKSDAEVVVDTAEDDNTHAKEKSGSNSAEDEVQGEDASEKPRAPKWVDSKVKAEVAAYGIDESDLQDFASREELDRVLRLLDKKAFEAGRKAIADDEEGATRNEKGQFAKKQEPAQDDQEPPAKKDGNRYEVSLSKDLYDDEIVDEFSRMRDYYESRLEALESRFADVSAKSEEERFDSFVDSLGYGDLFGKTGSESEKELERRRDLHVAVKAQLIGLERLGRPAELTDQLVGRVAKMVFADELGKKLLKQQTQKISRQSQLRQGGSPTKPLPPRDDPRDEADRLYRELERA
jgi:hypothetical protein